MNYSYKAVNNNGETVSGNMQGGSEDEIVRELTAMNLIPLHIQLFDPGKQKAGKSAQGVNINFGRGSKEQDVMNFTQDLATLLLAGLPIDRSLKILSAGCGNSRFKEIIEDILRSVEKGRYLSEALAEHPAYFNRFYLNMIEAGEAGGDVEETLTRMGAFLEKSRELKNFIVSAMLYPAFLAGVGLISVVLLLTFVIPRFSVIFDSMEQTLPLSTRILILLSQWLKQYWWLGIVLSVLVAITGIICLRLEQGRLKRDQILLKLPMIGDLIRNIEIARFSRTLGSLIHSGVPILKGLELTEKIIGNRVIIQNIEQVRSRVQSGEKLAAPLAATGIFPELAIQMIMVGEETGKMDTMLLRVAENYEKIVQNLIKKFVNLLEPVMIMLMGVLIGGIVISMLLAIFSMNEMVF